MFVMYVAPIGNVIDKHGLSEIYSDHKQLHVMITLSNQNSALAKLEGCIEDICNWMAQNKPMLDDFKTVTRRILSPQDSPGVHLGHERFGSVFFASLVNVNKMKLHVWLLRLPLGS